MKKGVEVTRLAFDDPIKGIRVIMESKNGASEKLMEDFTSLVELLEGPPTIVDERIRRIRAGAYMEGLR